MSGLGSRFDWYAATFDDLDDGRIPATLALVLGGNVSRGKGRLGYAECAVIEQGDAVLARVFTRSARLGEVHVVTSGDACDRVVPVLRRLWPEHRVSRADSALDFVADFADFDAEALAFAQERRLAYRLVTDSEGGATRYLGATSSEVMVRVYKKSEQLRKLHPERAAGVPDGVVRVELQVRPGSKIKAAVASMTADEVWGLGAWSRDFAATFLGVQAERVATHFRRPSDWSRAVHWLGQQYGPMVARRVALVGREQVKAEILQGLGLSDG